MCLGRQLWRRFHNVHHTDLDLGVSTAIRFHFGEMLMSAVFRAAAVLLIGAGPVVVLVYEVAFETLAQTPSRLFKRWIIRPHPYEPSRSNC